MEIEHKFLIRMPGNEVLEQPGAQRSRIVQTYLQASPGVTARVRKRDFVHGTVYTHTEKRRVSALSCFEDEREISAEEYLTLLKRKDPASRPVEKTRVTFPYEGRLLEIDIYPFWQSQAILEIELPSEDAAYAIPPTITVIREVSGDGRYKNRSLAKEIPPEG